MTLLARTGLLLIALVFATGAYADNYPSRPLTYVVPYTPGGVTDNGARAVAKVLGEKLGQPVIVENKPGAAGIVGTEYVVRSKHDGYTFIYAGGPRWAHSPISTRSCHSSRTPRWCRCMAWPIRRCW